MIKRNTPAFIGGIFGFLIWIFLSTVFSLILSEDWLLSNVLDSKVNAITFYLAGVLLGIVYERNGQLITEAAWKDRTLLPDYRVVTNYSELKDYPLKVTATNASQRSTRLIEAVFRALSVDWNRATAQSALDATYKMLTEEIQTRYRKCSLIADFIMRVGFFGTLLGAALAIPHLDDQVLLRALISISFHTSLVAFVLGAAVSWAFTALRDFDETVLQKLYQSIFDRLIQAIKQPEAFAPNATAQQNGHNGVRSIASYEPVAFIARAGYPVSPHHLPNNHEASK